MTDIYDKLTYYFSDGEKGLNKLIEDYRETFSQIDEIGQKLLQGIYSTSEDYKEVLNTLTGAYMKLEPLYSLAEAHKSNEELRVYVSKKRELEALGEKVVATNLEKESSLAVANERRVRNIIEGFVLSAEKGIITAQTQLKSIQNKEYKPKEND